VAVRRAGDDDPALFLLLGTLAPAADVLEHT
jgi:hypothetical protein